ncbi:MAG: helix-turn-helix domain-containing protein [Ruminococcus sp.]|nr:helix-turn-helix domain-containing protein [Ruminococcus sp.]
MDMKIKRGQILKELRLDKKLSQQDVADISEVSARAYQKYEYGTAEPNFDNLSKLADFYGVSTDYLLGRESASLPANAMEVLEIEKSVDDDEFMRLYNELPDYAKQIFVDVMAKLAWATEQAKTQQKQRHVERLGDIEDVLKQEEEAKRKDAI